MLSLSTAHSSSKQKAKPRVRVQKTVTNDNRVFLHTATMFLRNSMDSSPASSQISAFIADLPFVDYVKQILAMEKNVKI